MNRGPVAEIDLSALVRNLRIATTIAGTRRLIAVVKADAYGHGSVEVAKCLTGAGVSCLAVAFTGEARVLREGGISVPIIVLFDRSDLPDFFTYGFTPVIQDAASAADFSREAVRRGTTISVHLKIDTGMGRVGMDPSVAVSEGARIARMEGVFLEGLMSHFSEADLADRSFARQQLEVFQSVRTGLEEALGRPLLCHMANSAALLSFEQALLDAVRPGLMVYGYAPVETTHELLRVMKIKTTLLVVRRLAAGSPVSYGRTFVTKRESRIGVVPVGYADGFSRLFSNNAEMLVNGKRAPVVGRVCMDLTMVDLTEVEDAVEGSEVVILGRQGGGEITATELAARLNSIPYEVLTSLGNRARREYIQG